MGDREDGIARRKSLGIKAAAVTVGVVAALASLSSGACADSSVAFFPALAASEVPSDAAMSVIAGQGGAAFGAPALEVGLQANGRVATDPAGSIYVSSQLDAQVGKIAAPSTWSPQIVSSMTTTPRVRRALPGRTDLDDWLSDRQRTVLRDLVRSRRAAE